MFDPVSVPGSSETAAQIVWRDAFLTNVDRTVKNTNMLTWHKELWLIDHGASLYFHHSWRNWEKHALNPFQMIKDHVLLPYAAELESVDKEFTEILTPDKIIDIVNQLPDDWLHWTNENESADDIRNIYKNFLIQRLNNSDLFIKEAQNARKVLI